MFQMDIKTPEIDKCSIASRLGLAREVDSNPSDCQKYNKNQNLFLNIIHHKILFLFL